MTRTEMYHGTPGKLNLLKWASLFLFLLFVAALLVGFSRYSQSTIKIDAPKVDNGKKVIVHLPNGKEVFTFEKLIVEENGKIYYRGETTTLDLTGGTVEYADWE